MYLLTEYILLSSLANTCVANGVHLFLETIKGFSRLEEREPFDTVVVGGVEGLRRAVLVARTAGGICETKRWV